MSLKKDKRRWINKTTKVVVHKSYTDDGQLRMIIVKDQWTAILDMYYLCNDRQRQEKLASLILYTKHMLTSITLNDIFHSKVVALYNLDK